MNDPLRNQAEYRSMIEDSRAYRLNLAHRRLDDRGPVSD
jgi:hypothetical protein